MLTEILGDYPQVKVIDLLISHPFSEYSKKDLADGAGIARGTLYDFFPKLDEYHLIKPTRRLGNAQLYQANMESPAMQAISAFQLQLAEMEIEKQVKNYNGEEPTPEEVGDALQELDRILPDEEPPEHEMRSMKSKKMNAF